jgi:hypothetical protein
MRSRHVNVSLPGAALVGAALASGIGGLCGGAEGRKDWYGRRATDMPILDKVGVRGCIRGTVRRRVAVNLNVPKLGPAGARARRRLVGSGPD